MKKHRFCKMIILVAVLSVLLCACGDSGNDVIESKKNKATQGATSQPVNPNENTPTPKQGENTPTPTQKAGGNTPTQGAQSGDTIMVTAYFQNASYTEKTDAIDFELDWDYVLFKKNDFEWTLDLKGQTIVLDRAIKVTNNLTITNGTIVVKEGVGITLLNNFYYNVPLFKSGEYGDVKFVVEGGTGIRISQDQTLWFENTPIIVNGGIGVEMTGGSFSSRSTDGNDATKQAMQVNGGTGLVISNTKVDYIDFGFPMIVEKDAVGYSFVNAECTIGGDILNNGGTAIKIDEAANVGYNGYLYQKSGTGIINKGELSLDSSKRLYSESGLLLKNSGYCKEVFAVTIPGIVYTGTLIENDNGAVIEDISLAMVTAKDAVGIDNHGQILNSLMLVGGMPRETNEINCFSFDGYYKNDIPEFDLIMDFDYKNTFENSKVCIIREDGSFVNNTEFGREIMAELNATDDKNAAYPNCSVALLNESSTPIIYDLVNFYNYGQGGITVVNESAASFLRRENDAAFMDLYDYSAYYLNDDIVSNNGNVLLNKGYISVLNLQIYMKGKDSTGLINEGTIEAKKIKDNDYAALRIECSGKSVTGFVNNNNVNCRVLIEVSNENNTGLINNSTLISEEEIRLKCSGTGNTGLINNLKVESPNIDIYGYRENSNVYSNCTGVLNAGEIVIEKFWISADNYTDGRALSNADSGKVSTDLLRVEIEAYQEEAADCLGVYNEGEIRALETRLTMGGKNAGLLMNVGTFTADTLNGRQDQKANPGCFISNSGVLTVVDSFSLSFWKNCLSTYMSDTGTSAFLGSADIGYYYIEEGSEKYESIFKK